MLLIAVLLGYTLYACLVAWIALLAFIMVQSIKEHLVGE